jgi:hypothetical protein
LNIIAFRLKSTIIPPTQTEYLATLHEEAEKENDSHIYLCAIAVKLNVKFMTDGREKTKNNFHLIFPPTPPSPQYIQFLLILKNVVHDKR